MALYHGTAFGLAAYDGQQLVGFGGINTAPGGSLAQTFTTVVGQNYVVTYYVGQSGTGNFSLTGTAFDALGNLLASNRCVSVSQTWIERQLGFTAPTTNTTIVFMDTSVADIQGADVGLSAVSVAGGPAPSLPVITTSPVSQAVSAGAPATFTASASGGPSTVQWYLVNYLGTNAVAGAISNTLNVTAGAATAGGYYAVFSNTAGSATTSTADLGVTGLAFVNGSFTSPIVSGGMGLNPGDTELTGWTIGGPGGNMALYHGTAFGLAAYDGQQLVGFGGINTAPGGSLAQTFTTVVGQNYVVTYYVGQSGTGNFSLTGTAFDALGNLLASNRCVSVSQTWIERQLGFTAPTTNTTIVFMDTSVADIQGADVGLSAVSVAGGPAPSLPVITTSPVSQAVSAGAPATFTASASGGPSTVQWYLVNYLGTNAVAGAINNTLNVIAGSTTAGGYFAVFNNTVGSATTSTAELAVTGLAFVNGSFEIINHAAISSGNSAALYPGDTWLTGWTVGGPGSGDLAVQNGPGDSGTLNPYDGQQWIIFNAGNTAPGGILSQSFTTTVGESYSVSFAVGRAGSGAISLTATALAADSTVLASNYCVPPTSGVWTIFQMGFTALTTNTTLVFKDTSTVTVAVDMALDDVTVVGEPTTGVPVVVTWPASQTVNAGTVVSFSASAAGSPSTLQWYFGTNEVSGAAGTVSPLTVTASDGTAGNYVAVFSNSFGMATTMVAVLTVVDPPVITISPASQAVAAGTPVTFTAAASGSPSAVQWYFGTSAIAGGTGTNLTFTAFGSAAGNYKAVFSNGAGTATTAVATLTVNAGPFTNGGFELINNHTALAGNSATTILPGSTWLNNWSVGGCAGHTAVAKGSYYGFAPYEGQQFLVFAAGGGSVSQIFATLPGVHYALSLAAGKYDGTGAVSVTAAVWADDGTLLSSNQFAPASGAWTLYPFGFTATTTNTTLVLTDTSTGTYSLDVALDDVTLVSAPVIVDLAVEPDEPDRDDGDVHGVGQRQSGDGAMVSRASR